MMFCELISLLLAFGPVSVCVSGMRFVDFIGGYAVGADVHAAWIRYLICICLVELKFKVKWI